MRRETINGWNITIDRTWCEAKNEKGEIVFNGNVEENMTCEKVYQVLTARLEFKLKGEVLLSYDLFNSFPGEKKATLEALAQENNCNVGDIEVIRVVENV